MKLLGLEREDKTLEELLFRSELPQALLFSGPAFSGKRTLALSLARKILKDPLPMHQQTSLALLGPFFRHEEVIFYTQRALHGSLELLIEWTQLYLKRFNSSFLPESQEKRLEKQLQEISELITNLRPRDIPHLEKTLLAFIQQSPQQYTIEQIRKLKEWSYQKARHGKVVILDNADAMNLSSANGLLKLLEEPPEDFYLILLSSQSHKLLKTILSRLSRYTLKKRTEETQKALYAQLFPHESPQALDQAFADCLSPQKDLVKKSMEIFLSAATGGGTFPVLSELEEAIKMDSQLIETSYRCLIDVLRVHLFQEPHDARLIQRGLEEITKFWRQGQTHHLNARLILENTFFFIGDLYAQLRQQNTQKVPPTR